MREFVEASDALVAVLRAFMLGREQREYPMPSIALDEATRRYNAAKDMLSKSTADQVVTPEDAVSRLRSAVEGLPGDSTVTDISVGDIRTLIMMAGFHPGRGYAAGEEGKAADTIMSDGDWKELSWSL